MDEDSGQACKLGQGKNKQHCGGRGTETAGVTSVHYPDAAGESKA